jgi:putative DNA methylase
MTSYPKRLIEVDLPIARISAHARREKSIRHGHISTLHMWWARRPLAACRAVICAALWPDPADPNCPQAFRDAAARHITDFARRADGDLKLLATSSQEGKARWAALAKAGINRSPTDEAELLTIRAAILDFIADFANWANSTVTEYLETTRALTQAAHEALGGEPGTRPLVVDPFAGGGAIPLEALRVGGDAFASDLNPVAVLLNKVVLEYIPRYGERLADEVRRWGQWVKEQAMTELVKFYPTDSDGATPIAYLWARTILSEAPGQDDFPVEVPLIKSMWLCKKSGRNRVLRWRRTAAGDTVTETTEATYCDGTSRKVRRPLLEVVDPDDCDGAVDSGTSSGGSATCPVTGFTMSVETVRKQLCARKGGAADARLIGVVTISASTPGRCYRMATDTDRALAASAAEFLDRAQRDYVGEMSLVPDEKLNHLRGFFNIILYGMEEWGQLFTPRQLLTLTTLSRLVKQVGQAIEQEDCSLAEAVQTLLALALGKQADSNSSLCAWRPTTQDIGHTFGRQALPMVWDFVEGNVFSGSTRDWISAVEGGLQAISSLDAGIKPGHAAAASATAQVLADDSADVLFTDPPYYAAVPYADLSDFFYCWLRRTLVDRQPSLFSGKLTPKDQECVALSHRAAMYRNKDNAWFESSIMKACAESRRVVKPSGIGTIVFASKETVAWEAMLAGAIDSGWTVTASWPIDTEMGSRLRAKNSAVLASSIHIVCRPREMPDGTVRQDVGEWRDVLTEWPVRIHEWMPRLAQEGVVGADAIFACLGPALEIFSRYSRVEKASGEKATLRDYLEHVWAAVSTEALSMIFEDADAAGLEPDARLTAMWLWTLGGGSGKAGVNGNGKANGSGPHPDPLPEGEGDEEEDEDADESGGKGAKIAGYVLEFDAARKIAQGLGIHLEKSESIVEIKGDKARLRPVSERTQHLFDKDTEAAPTGRGKKKVKSKQKTFFEELDEAEAAEAGWGELKGPPPGSTALDRLHQSMILFAAGRGELLKRFLTEEGIGTDARFWKLAQSFSALYPRGSDEKRWVDGVLARKKGLGL